MNRINLLLAIPIAASLCVITASSQSEPRYFSFVNAIATDLPTVLKVNGKAIGEPFALGFNAGGLGFDGSSVKVTVENGEFSKETELPLTADQSPILVGHLVLDQDSLDESGLPRKQIALASIPASSKESASLIRVVYVGEPTPVELMFASEPRDEKPNPRGGVVQTLRSGEPVEISVQAPLGIFDGGKRIGSFQTQDNDNWILIFYRNSANEINYVSAADYVYKW